MSEVLVQLSTLKLKIKYFFPSLLECLMPDNSEITNFVSEKRNTDQVEESN